MQEIEELLAKRKQSGATLTLVTGVFDVLHLEHKRFLQKAKALSDLLIVGLESDLRVKQMKGADRPINHSAERLKNLSKWQLADSIFILPEQFSSSADHRRLIAEIRPDFMAVSAHTSFLEAKEQILSEFGAKLVVVHDYNPLFSSTKAIESINKKDNKKG